MILFAVMVACSVAGLHSFTISRYGTMAQKVPSVRTIGGCLSVLITMSVEGRRLNLVRIIQWAGR
ncbi:MAG: hypothetical protein PHO83_06415, partial [Geobacteraceae bacterium]|nr:hypothetical protein [Geobacteraceae bacterium]